MDVIYYIKSYVLRVLGLNIIKKDVYIKMGVKNNEWVAMEYR